MKLVLSWPISYWNEYFKRYWRGLIPNNVYGPKELAWPDPKYESNEAFLAHAPLEEMAVQIDRCVGPSGSNREHVIELARALRGMGYEDRHVFEVEDCFFGGLV